VKFQNKAAPRAAVLEPIKIVITNYPEGKVEWLDAENNQETKVLDLEKFLF
jgi:glutaminyl-tRNA synthetase